jgi:hypothetical protein
MWLVLRKEDWLKAASWVSFLAVRFWALHFVAEVWYLRLCDNKLSKCNVKVQCYTPVLRAPIPQL